MRLMLTLATILAADVAMAYEEPVYEVVGEYEEYEVRKYAPYIIVETTVEGDFEDARNAAFRRLFAYISGDNQTAENVDVDPDIAGTSRDGGTKIEMTIPVVSTNPEEDPTGADNYTTYFVVPSKYTLETVPRPTDDRIRIREIPERLVAVRQYSGRTNAQNYLGNERVLLDALGRDRIEVVGEPVFAVYNGPFTPWFLRRNEVMVEITR